MRIPHSLTALGGALALLAAVSAAQAQPGRATLSEEYDSGPQWSEPSGGAQIVDGFAPEAAWGPGPGPAPAPYGVPGAMFRPQMQPAPPTALVPTQAPQTMNPWPEISPFYPPNVAFQQHRNDNGVWFKDTVHRRRDYEFSMEYVQIQLPEVRDTLIGSRHLPISRIPGLDAGIGIPITGGGLGPALPINSVYFGRAAYPFPFVLEGNTYVAFEDGDRFPIRHANVLEGGNNSNGMRLRWGFTNEDGTGFFASGFWGADAHTQVQYGRTTVNGVRITQDLAAFYTDLIFTRHGAIPLIDAVNLEDTASPVPGTIGLTQKFDLFFRLDHHSQAGGVDLNRYLGHLVRSNSFNVTSFMGARYFNLAEEFGFRGIDSGLGYTVVDDEEDPQFLRPDPGSIVIDTPLMESFLTSQVDSYMAGPQIGVKFDIGKHGNFHLWGQSTFGLLANHEVMEVKGDNIGVAAAHPEMHDGTQFLDNSFLDEERHTHVSPLLEQSINADIRLTHLMPFLKKSYMFEDARLRLGYTWTFIGEVQRAPDAIDWKGFPLFPSVRVERHNFMMNQLSIGINCPY